MLFMCVVIILFMSCSYLSCFAVFICSFFCSKSKLLCVHDTEAEIWIVVISKQCFFMIRLNLSVYFIIILFPGFLFDIFVKLHMDADC